jgi:hypothetical protein
MRRRFETQLRRKQCFGCVKMLYVPLSRVLRIRMWIQLDQLIQIQIQKRSNVILDRKIVKFSCFEEFSCRLRTSLGEFNDPKELEFSMNP